jgi:hypothetical protein
LGGNTARRSVERGAETAVWLATLPDQAHQPRASRLRHLTRRVGALLTGWRVHRGGFFRDRKPIPW